MKILIFTEGTILMHSAGANRSRAERVAQSAAGTPDIYDYATYTPIGETDEKIHHWQERGATIAYLTSRRKPEQIDIIRRKLAEHHFPDGELYFRQEEETYAEAAIRAEPDIIVEDDCESSDGPSGMVYALLPSSWQSKIISAPVPEFGGIDHLPDNPDKFLN